MYDLLRKEKKRKRKEIKTFKQKRIMYISYDRNCIENVNKKKKCWYETVELKERKHYRTFRLLNEFTRGWRLNWGWKLHQTKTKLLRVTTIPKWKHFQFQFQNNSQKNFFFLNFMLKINSLITWRARKWRWKTSSVLIFPS